MNELTVGQSKIVEQEIDFSARLELISNSVVTLQLQIDEIEEDKKNTNEKLVGIKQSHTHYQDSISALTTRIDQLSAQLTLIKRFAESKPNIIPKKTSQSQQIQTNAPPISVAAPFTLHDIQRRGMLLLAVVAPLNASSLSDVELVKLNDIYSGWRITAIEPDFIDIKALHSAQTLTLRSNK